MLIKFFDLILTYSFGSSQMTANHELISMILLFLLYRTAQSRIISPFQFFPTVYICIIYIYIIIIQHLEIYITYLKIQT